MNANILTDDIGFIYYLEEDHTCDLYYSDDDDEYDHEEDLTLCSSSISHMSSSSLDGKSNGGIFEVKRGLVVDELNSKSTKKLGIKAVQVPTLKKHHCKNMIACPCCKNYVENETKENSSSYIKPVQECNSSASPTKGESTIFDYTIKNVLKEGWLYKKGSGNDMLGLRAWKPRWVTLVLADVPGYQLPVPLLLTYWHYTVPKPTTVIALDSKFVIPMKCETKYYSDQDCFDIIFTKQSDHLKENLTNSNNNNVPTSRRFSASLKERDEWVFAIQNAISDYDSRKTSLRKQRARDDYNILPPRSPIKGLKLLH